MRTSSVPVRGIKLDCGVYGRDDSNNHFVWMNVCVLLINVVWLFWVLVLEKNESVGVRDSYAESGNEFGGEFINK